MLPDADEESPFDLLQAESPSRAVKPARASTETIYIFHDVLL